MKEDDKNISSLQLKKLVPASEIKSAVHDLNNLMNYIINGIEIIDDNNSADSKTKNILGNIKKNSKLASNILLQLSSAWSRPVNYKSTIRLNDTISDVINSVKSNINNSIRITFNRLNTDDKLIANKTELERVLLNLIINAQEAESSNVTISLKKNIIDKDEYFIIEISDNGKGIDVNDITKLFEEGFSTKEDKNLHGFGLSIVKKIIEKHSGSIKVKSELKKGTDFKLFLPTNPEKHNLNKLKGKTILLAEDDQFQREVLKDLLQSLDINVLTSCNGYEALEKIKHTNIDLLIIDMIMPGMDGKECISELKKMGYSFPIVLTSGTDISEVTSKNVSEVLKKPYNFETIQSLLVKLLV